MEAGDTLDSHGGRGRRHRATEISEFARKLSHAMRLASRALRDQSLRRCCPFHRRQIRGRSMVMMGLPID
ncbi:hypothetical protein HMPREF3223_02101 [Cutibacterium avidum]|nr:hypothetical protein HMPREF3223_02101 [Cutibacterium avidum]